MPFQGTRVPVTRQSAEAGWQSRGACRDHDPELFFPSEKAPLEVVRVQEATAKAVCRSCPVAGICLATALTRRMSYGVWGGLSADDRRAVLAARSATTSVPSLTTPTPTPASVPMRRTRVRQRRHLHPMSGPGLTATTPPDAGPKVAGA
jgi:WhiB family transcriptional regulator, redox-sensing transcriptional regulator